MPSGSITVDLCVTCCLWAQFLAILFTQKSKFPCSWGYYLQQIHFTSTFHLIVELSTCKDVRFQFRFPLKIELQPVRFLQFSLTKIVFWKQIQQQTDHFYNFHEVLKTSLRRLNREREKKEKEREREREGESTLQMPFFCAIDYMLQDRQPVLPYWKSCVHQFDVYVLHEYNEVQVHQKFLQIFSMQQKVRNCCSNYSRMVFWIHNGNRRRWMKAGRST